MEAEKALYISQEINPYLAPSTLSMLSRNIATGMQEQGVEVRTFMPKYGCINERRNQLHEVIRLSGLNISIDDTDHPLIIKVATLQPTRLQVYFIDNDDYFHTRLSSELETISHPEDNDERSIFFSLGVVETVKKLRWFPSVIHCTGWLTALCPLFIKTKYSEDPAFDKAKIVYSLINDKFEGELDPRFADKLLMTGIPADAIKSLAEGKSDYVALNKLAIDHCDAIVQSTEEVDPEVLAYAKASGKPMLDFPGEENAAAYAEFYATL
ncbi:MAG: glycogen/starch synthase [Clostridium sp.]|nr:glycogen/starch synthase [Clostridium sp.]